MIYYTASFVRAASIVALFAATLSSSAQNAVEKVLNCCEQPNALIDRLRPLFAQL